MAHFNFVISQNAKWGHAGFYIDCHRMTVPENILLQNMHWTKETTNIEPTHCLEVMLLVVALLSTLCVATLLSIVIVAEQLHV